MTQLVTIEIQEQHGDVLLHAERRQPGGRRARDGAARARHQHLHTNTLLLPLPWDTAITYQLTNMLFLKS